MSCIHEAPKAPQCTQKCCRNMVTTAATTTPTTATRPALATLLLSKIILQQIGPQKERLGVTKILLSCKTRKYFVQLSRRKL